MDTHKRELDALDQDLNALVKQPALLLAEAVARLGHRVPKPQVMFVQTQPREGIINFVSSVEFSKHDRKAVIGWLESLLPFLPAAQRAIELEVGRIPPSLVAGWAQYLSRNVLVKSVDLGQSNPRGLLLVSAGAPFCGESQEFVSGVGDVLGAALRKAS